MTVKRVCSVCLTESKEEAVCPVCGAQNWMYYDADNESAATALDIARSKLTQ